MIVVRIEGGFSGPLWASYRGGQSMAPRPGESTEAFERRAIAAARAAGATSVCFGGLPHQESRLRDHDGTWDGIE